MPHPLRVVRVLEARTDGIVHAAVEGAGDETAPGVLEGSNARARTPFECGRDGHRRRCYAMPQRIAWCLAHVHRLIQRRCHGGTKVRRAPAGLHPLQGPHTAYVRALRLGSLHRQQRIGTHVGIVDLMHVHIYTSVGQRERLRLLYLVGMDRTVSARSTACMRVHAGARRRRCSVSSQSSYRVMMHEWMRG
jgi:hypothetical protein